MVNSERFTKVKRLLETMVEYISLDLPNSTKTPRHDCEYSLNPEKGHCDFCADWSEAIDLIYGNEEEDQ